MNRWHVLEKMCIFAPNLNTKYSNHDIRRISSSSGRAEGRTSG